MKWGRQKPEWNRFKGELEEMNQRGWIYRLCLQELWHQEGSRKFLVLVFQMREMTFLSMRVLDFRIFFSSDPPDFWQLRPPPRCVYLRRVSVSLVGGFHRTVFGKNECVCTRVCVCGCVDAGIDYVKGYFCNFYETLLHLFMFRVCIHILIAKTFKGTNVKLHLLNWKCWETQCLGLISFP